jgi:hypothetical protein
VLAVRRAFVGDGALLGLEVEAPNGDQRRINPIATQGNSAAPTRATTLCRLDQLKRGVVVISSRVESYSAEKRIRCYEVYCRSVTSLTSIESGLQTVHIPVTVQIRGSPSEPSADPQYRLYEGLSSLHMHRLNPQIEGLISCDFRAI